MLRGGNGRGSVVVVGSREGKHPVGRTNVTKTEDPRRIHRAREQQRRKRAQKEERRSRWQTAYRVASFLHNLARQPREKLVPPSPGPHGGAKDSRVGAAPGRGPGCGEVPGTLSNIL